MMTKYVYAFKEGNKDMRNLLGGKGANLAEMTNLGLPIPQGFTISTEACTNYYDNGKKISEEIESQIFKALEELEKLQEKRRLEKQKEKLQRQLGSVVIASTRCNNCKHEM